MDHAVIWVGVPLAMLFAFAVAQGRTPLDLPGLFSGRAELVAPFPNCSLAHAAGYYSIPRGSPAYTDRQDGDDDGLACEPHRR